MQSTDIIPWYNKYLNFPYQHLGDNIETGIDCFNLCRLIYKEAFGWKQVRTPKEFDVITMSIGSTNITNHCALYIGANRILQTMVNRVSWTTVYGRYYKNYTIGIFRWIGMLN